MFWAKDFKKLIGFNHTWLVFIGVLVSGFSFPFIFLMSGEGTLIEQSHEPLKGWTYALVLHAANLYTFRQFKIKDQKQGKVNTFKLFFLRNYPVHILLTALLTVLMTTVFFCTPDQHMFKWIIPRSVVGTVILMSIVIGFYETAFYMTALNQSTKETERLQKENIQAQLDILKAQVQPHFLFNSLNTLVSIIPESPDQAVKYVQNLSDIYRYILEVKDKKIIEVKTELTCVESYISMLQTRFGDKLRCNIDSEFFTDSEFIVPLALQMVLENAVKHNIISEKKPLSIEVQKQDGYIVVSNILQLKIESENSTKTGLQNIEKRYLLLGKEGFKISQTQECFKVYLPIIKVTE